MAYLSAGLTEVARDDTAAGRAVARAPRDAAPTAAVALDEERARRSSGDGRRLPELSVMASGCLGLISSRASPDA